MRTISLPAIQLVLYLLFSNSPTLKAEVLDSFEKGNGSWEVKEWGDKVSLKASDEFASAGQRGLKVSFTEKQRVADRSKGAFLRRSIGGMVGERRAILLDVYHPGQKPIEIAIGLDADQYYESVTKTLKPGWNRNLRFPLLEPTFKANSSAWKHTEKIQQDLILGSIYVVFYFNDLNEGFVVLDQIRSEGQPAKIKQAQSAATPSIKAPPKILSVMGTRGTVEQYGLFEQTINFDALYFDPYDHKQILVQAEFISPSKKTYTVEGFLFSGVVTRSKPVLNPIWNVRFSPTEAGAWSYRFLLTNPVGQSKSKTYQFQVAESKNPGFLRVDKQDSRYFSFDSGKFYYPIGQNLGWDSLENYEAYFAKMAENGQNWARIWMSHWSFGLEWKPMGHYRGLGNYNLHNARRLDKLIKLADQYGIYLQLVFDFHGAFSSHVNPEWHNNPYNKINGGFLDSAKEFFTSSKAKELYKQRLRYIVARWGYSTRIMAWEFFNEINFSDDFDPKADTAWHKEMAAWLKSQDPYRHMITTSYYDYINADTYALDDLDYSQYHMYKKRAYRLMSDVVPRLEALKKPFFIAEFGSDSRDGEDDKDKAGVFLHAGLWSQLMQPAAGNAMPWWWNTHIHPNNLYGHFRAVAQFFGDHDPRGHKWQRFRTRHQVDSDEGLWLEILGLRNQEKSWYWICDSLGKRHEKRSAPYEFNNVDIDLGLYKDGKYKIEFWDTYKGQIQDATLIDHRHGDLKISLPRFQNDLAVKVKRVG